MLKKLIFSSTKRIKPFQFKNYSIQRINKTLNSFSKIRKYSTNEKPKNENEKKQEEDKQEEKKEKVIEETIPEEIPETEEEKQQRLKKEKRQKIGRILLISILTILGSVGYFGWTLFDKTIKYSNISEAVEKSLFHTEATFSVQEPKAIEIITNYLQDSMDIILSEEDSKIENKEKISQVIGDLKSVQLLNPNFCAIMTHSFYILPKLKTIEANGKVKTRLLQTYSHSDINMYFPLINHQDNLISVLDVKISSIEEPKEGEDLNFELKSISLANPEVFMGSVDEKFFEPLFGDTSNFTFVWDDEEASFPIYSVKEKKIPEVWHKLLEPMSQAVPYPYIGHMFLETIPDKYITK
eukprot:gene11941-5342_t